MWGWTAAHFWTKAMPSGVRAASFLVIQDATKLCEQQQATCHCLSRKKSSRWQISDQPGEEQRLPDERRKSTAVALGPGFALQSTRHFFHQSTRHAATSLHCCHQYAQGSLLCNTVRTLTRAHTVHCMAWLLKNPQRKHAYKVKSMAAMHWH